MDPKNPKGFIGVYLGYIGVLLGIYWGYIRVTYTPPN